MRSALRPLPIFALPLFLLGAADPAFARALSEAHKQKLSIAAKARAERGDLPYRDVHGRFTSIKAPVTPRAAGSKQVAALLKPTVAEAPEGMQVARPGLLARFAAWRERARETRQINREWNAMLKEHDLKGALKQAMKAEGVRGKKTLYYGSAASIGGTLGVAAAVSGPAAFFMGFNVPLLTKVALDAHREMVAGTVRANERVLAVAGDRVSDAERARFAKIGLVSK